MSFDYQGIGVLVDRFGAKILAEQPEDGQVAEMLRNAVRVAALSRMGINAPVDLPVIYAPNSAPNAAS